MILKQCFLTKNDCFKSGKTIKPSGIVVHSTGANNPNLRRYIQPDDGILGANKYNNHWNRSGVNKCVNAFIGKALDNQVMVYQTLPWDRRPWGCGSGKKGSYNNSHIQFEICEDALNDSTYFNDAFGAAIELCAYLAKEYNIKVSNIVSHHEAYLAGYASGHSDCDHWLKKFNKDMNWFRKQVQAKLDSVVVVEEPVREETTASVYLVKITTPVLNIRKGAGTKYKIVGTVKKGEVYTIVEESNGWGKLKSGAGWISLAYTSKY